MKPIKENPGVGVEYENRQADLDERFWRLLDKYGNLPEPLQNWITSDLVHLIEIVDAELQRRAPPDSSPPWEV